ncbi:hypothetical protein O1611_g3815 [Lasiodiplodia mahajangana]|uniref:Uncharacterized protein n=1 Tax=Lasiodiplodia mahajangana TaxID=1108764 RepID=A0ACC2JQN8_9PEZI|nr:hypothetical protein O1611_g3815 [Lasiodiplodia mahajangana]
MAPPLEPPPDYNRFRSWLAVAGASIALYCTVGFLNAFGVYQEYYGTGLLKAYTDSDISWIGSVAIFLLYIGSPVAGLLVDRIGPTILLVIGSIGQLLAVFLSSLCSQYYQLFLSQAVLLGASMSLILTPCVAVVSRRMPHRRGFALGITIGGSSIGGILWPIMLEQLLYADGVSFGWVQRAVGFTMLPLLAVACLTVIDAEKEIPTTPAADSEKASEGSVIGGTSSDSSPEEKPKANHPIVEMFKNFTFVLLCLGLGLIYLGLFTPFFYISAYAVDKGTSSSTAFYLISVVNGASFFGRVIPGHLADRYGHFNMCTLSVLASGIIGFTWTAAYSLPGMIIWSIAYGFTSGAVLSLQSACVAKISKREQQGTALGLVMGCVSIAALVGTPISGQILLRAGYIGLAVWTGATILAGGVVLAVAKLRLDHTMFSEIGGSRVTTQIGDELMTMLVDSEKRRCDDETSWRPDRWWIDRSWVFRLIGPTTGTTGPTTGRLSETRNPGRASPERAREPPITAVVEKSGDPIRGLAEPSLQQRAQPHLLFTWVSWAPLRCVAAIHRSSSPQLASSPVPAAKSNRRANCTPLLLAGCSSSSPLIPDIFLLSIYYKHYTATPSTAQVDYNVNQAISNIVGSAHLQVRVGYFGICVNSDGGSWLCNNNATALANDLSVDQDPLNLVWLAGQFKDMIVFPYLLIIAIIFAFVCLLLLATFPGWHEEEDSEGSEREIKPFPSRPVSQIALAIIFIASIFVLVSVLWQHTASVAASIIAQDFGNGSVRSGVGTSAIVMGWFSFALLIIVTIGLLVMILSIQVLTTLADQ